MTRQDIVEELLSRKIIAVVRLADAEKALQMTEALLQGGVSCIEVTLTSADPIGMIGKLADAFQGRALIGVGSVTDAAQATKAVAAGADYVVSPVMRPALVEAAHRLDRAAVIGAMTPTEILGAHEAGADIVKVFPATKLGPGYFRDVLAPLPYLKLAPTGGVDLGNVREFMEAGAVCVGVGSSLLRKDLLSASDWQGLTALAEEFVKRIG